MQEAQKEVSTFSQKVQESKGNADKNISSLGKGIQTAMKWGAGATAAAGAALGGFALKTASTADKVDKMSQKLGLSRQGYQEIGYAMSRSGADLDSFGGGMKALTANMDKANEGNKTAQENFAKLGVSITDSNGHLRSQQDVLRDTIIAMQGMEAGTEKSRLATELFGKQGQELLPLLNSGKGSFEELTQRANDLGLVMGDSAVDAGVTFGDTLDDVKNSLGMVAANIGAQVLPVLTDMLNVVLEHMPQIQAVLTTVFTTIQNVFNFIAQHTTLFATLATAIGIVVAAIGLYNAVAAVKAAMDAAQVVSLGGLIAAKMADAAATMAALAPYILIVAAIAAVIAIIVLCVKHWDTIKQVVSDVCSAIGGFVQTAFSKIKSVISTVMNAVKSVVTTVWNGIKSVFTTVCNAIKTVVTTAWNGIKTAITTVCNGIKTVVTTVWNGIKTVVTTVSNAIKTAATTAWNGIKTAVTTVVNGIKAAVTTGFNAIKSVVTTVSNGIRSAVTTAWNGIKTVISTVVNGVKSVVSSGFNAVKTAITTPLNAAKNAVSNIFNGIKNAASRVVSGIKGAFSGMHISIPKPKLPHFSVSWSDLGPVKIPHLSVSWYAKGGVFDNPTFFGYGNGAIGGLGENGAEAVVPLENNTEWLTKIANMLSQRMGVGQPIVMEVDGKTFAQISVDSINQLTRQTGSLPLKFA